jgi:hypothetical protein
MKLDKQAVWVAIVLILVAASSRLLPHWHNFTAVGGVGLFGGYFFRKKIWAFLVPLLAMWISDLILNNLVYSAFNDGFVFFSKWMIWSYLGFVGMVLISQMSIKTATPLKILTAVGLGTMVFFILSNFGAFLYDPIYQKTPDQLLVAYIAGLPFLLNTVLANLFFTSILFVLYELVISKSLELKTN